AYGTNSAREHDLGTDPDADRLQQGPPGDADAGARADAARAGCGPQRRGRCRELVPACPTRTVHATSWARRYEFAGGRQRLPAHASDRRRLRSAPPPIGAEFVPAPRVRAGRGTNSAATHELDPWGGQRGDGRAASGGASPGPVRVS